MLNVSTLSALVVLAYVIILGFGWRTASALLADRPIGQAMAWIW